MKPAKLLALLIATMAVSCRTHVALVDDTFGHERVHGGRFAHVRTARAPLAVHADGRMRFVLDVTLANDTDAAWAVAVDAFVLHADGDGASVPSLELPVGAVLATVAAHTHFEARLPVLLTLAPGMTVNDIERVPILLTFTDADTELLHRRIVVGSYSQLGQLIRVVGLTTAGLLLISLF